MFATLRMKRLLLCLIPWMAMTAAAQDNWRPAEISMSHLGTAPAWRLGEECYVNPSAFIKWKWPYSFVGNEATIQAEGRTVRVMGKTINTRFVVPMSEVLTQLGASYQWAPDRDVMNAFGSIRSVTVRNGKINAESTLSVLPTVTYAQNPSRIVVDIVGARLDQNCKNDLDVNARVAQFSENTVRVVVETAEKPPVAEAVASRTVDIPFTPVAVAASGKTPASTALDKDVQTVPVTPTPTPTPGPVIAIGPASVESDTEQSARIRIPAASAFLSTPQLRRIDPLTMEMVFPKAQFAGALVNLHSAAIAESSVSNTESTATIRLVTTRPMGAQFSVVGNGVELVLIKPRVGDGKLAGKVIVVDPGHGAHDNGASSPNKDVFEKNLTLAIGKLVAQELTANGATVIMTRSTDVFVELKERGEIANRNKADFFVSVHINSNKTNDSASGTITFHHGGSQMGNLMAVCIQNEIKKIDGMPAIGVWADTQIYKKGGFAVLRYSTMPGVLLELGFINNSKDRKRMQEADYHQSVARAVVKGIRVYLGDVKP